MRIELKQVPEEGGFGGFRWWCIIYVFVLGVFASGWADGQAVDGILGLWHPWQRRSRTCLHRDGDRDGSGNI